MKNLWEKMPDTPGVYLMKDANGRLLYIGKAANLKRRVSSYFLRSHDTRIELLVSKIKKIDYKKTDSALEALILESNLIKKYQPQFNIREKDDKSFLYIGITKEEFPRVILVRGRDLHNLTTSDVVRLGKRFGPFVSASSLREALRILRRIFPWNVHEQNKIGNMKRSCFEYEIGLCPGTCIGKISKKEYAKNVKNIAFFLSGEKNKIILNLEKEMKLAVKKLEFEKAEKIKRQIFALNHINDTSIISGENLSEKEDQRRIEGYDISNISGVSAVGSMVVFVDGEPRKNEYRKFKIKTVKGQNDTGMLREVFQRRFKKTGDDAWKLPDLILVDGGVGQVNSCEDVLRNLRINIPVLGIAKGEKREKNEIIGKIPNWTNMNTLIHVRDEAHRFAINYHRILRSSVLLD